MSVKLSIIITSYNRAKLLNKCIKSIYNNLNNNYQIVVVDDNSSDDTFKICKYWKDKFNFFKFIKLKKNKGPSYCRNLGVKNCSGEYIVFSDSDDVYSKGAINILLKKLENSEKDLLLFNYKVLGENNKIISSTNLNKKDKNLKKIITKLTTSYTRWNIWSYMLKKKFILKNKIFFQNLKQNEDWIYTFQLLNKVKKFEVINNYIYNYRFHKIVSLGKEIGYITGVSRLNALISLIKIFYNLNSAEKNSCLKLFNEMKNTFVNDFLINLSICNKRELRLINNIIKKNKKILLQNKGLLGNKNLINLILNVNKITDYENKFFDSIYNITKKNYIIFCIGFIGRVIVKKLILTGYKPSLIIDNNPIYKNQKFENVMIKDFNYLKKKSKIYKDSKIIICNLEKNSVKNIFDQLKKYNFNNKNVINIKRFIN